MFAIEVPSRFDCREIYGHVLHAAVADIHYTKAFA